MKLRPLFLLPVLLAGALGLAAWYRLVRPVTVQVATPATDVPVEVYGLGTVEARVLSRIGFEVIGTLAELHADQLDAVARGAVLARLDHREQEARAGQAQASVRQAEAGVRQAEANLAKARTVLEERQRTNRRQQTLVRDGTVSAEAAFGRLSYHLKRTASDSLTTSSSVRRRPAKRNRDISRLAG